MTQFSRFTWRVPRTLALPPGIYYFRGQLADNCEPNAYSSWSDCHFAFEVGPKNAEVR